jgi:ParB family chromosome partitioning protein
MKQQPTLQNLPVALLDTTGNIREDYGDLRSLAGTFEDKRPNEPPVVIPYPDREGYAVESGNRRVEAARQDGIDRLWCVVKPEPLDPTELRKRQLIADLYHKPLTPLERAQAMQALLEETGLTQAGLGRILGKTEGEISRNIALLDTAPPVQQAIQEEEISWGIAQLLIPLSQDEQAEVLPDILETAGERTGKPTVAAARRIIRRTKREKMRLEAPMARERDEQTVQQPRPAQKDAEEPLPDPYTLLLDAGENVRCVHLLYELQEAAQEIATAWEVCKLDDCSQHLRQQIQYAARDVRDVATKIAT